MSASAHNGLLPRSSMSAEAGLHPSKLSSNAPRTGMTQGRAWPLPTPTPSFGRCTQMPHVCFLRAKSYEPAQHDPMDRHGPRSSEAPLPMRRGRRLCGNRLGRDIEKDTRLVARLW